MKTWFQSLHELPIDALYERANRQKNAIAILQRDLETIERVIADKENAEVAHQPSAKS
jgi:hypothetical protein